MRKIIILPMVLIFCFAMISCGGSEEKKIDRELNEFNQKLELNNSK